MIKEISISSLQKEINELKNRINKLEIDDKNKNNKIKSIKIKDPNKPKKNIPSFFHFNNEKRELFKKKNPSSKIYVAQITKEAKKEWDILDNLKKKKYIDIADKDKKTYEREMKKYNENRN